MSGSISLWILRAQGTKNEYLKTAYRQKQVEAGLGMVGGQVSPTELQALVSMNFAEGKGSG